MSSLIPQLEPSTAAWYSRLVNRKFLLHSLSVLVLVHTMEVSALGFILRSFDAIPYLAISLGILVTLSLFFLLLGMYSGDTLIYRSLYHAGHFLAIACGYTGFFPGRVPLDADIPVSTMSWPISTLVAVGFFLLVCVMNGVYNTAMGTTGGILRPLLTLFQMHMPPDAEETHEMCNHEPGNHSIIPSLSAFSHQVQRRPSFNEETRALLCPSPVEEMSKEDLDELV